MLAIIDAYKNGLLKSKYWSSNLIAGVIVGIVALPLAMAFAIASGVKPEQGIYTAIFAGIIVAVFGGSRVQIAGPTAAFIVILAGIVAQYGVGGLQIATFMAGFILLFMGITKLGSVVKFIPEPVIVGFTSGIAITIFVGQWQNFFGLSASIALDASFYQKLRILILALPHLNTMTTALGCFSVFLVVLSPFLLKRIPSPLIAMVLATLLLVIFHIKGVATLGSAFGGIPSHLPPFHIPNMTFNEVLSLIAPAFTIALLGAIESLLSAAAADGMAGTRHNSNQELIGQGLANIVSPLFGGIAATGAIARTATNIRNGGTSPLAAIIHSLTLIAFILLLSPLASYVPLCALSAILFVVSYNIADFGCFFDMIRRAPRYDVVVLLTTFFLTVFTNLVIAVNIGVILAMLFFVRRMHQSVTIEQQHPENLALELSPEQHNRITLSGNIIIYAIQGPFFFGMTEKFEHALAITHTEPKIIIFRLKQVPFMDITGIQTFHEIIQQFHKHGVKVYICEVNARVQQKLQKNGILPYLEQEKTFYSLSDVLSQDAFSFSAEQ
ncbi:MAG: STAS domain-containing protein [Gammaproteobacteria bacterium]|nr:STAS domain-containing protein [Gammaproteobacteria bacterium]